MPTPVIGDERLGGLRLLISLLSCRSARLRVSLPSGSAISGKRAQEHTSVGGIEKAIETKEQGS